MPRTVFIKKSVF